MFTYWAVQQCAKPTKQVNSAFQSQEKPIPLNENEKERDREIYGADEKDAQQEIMGRSSGGKTSDEIRPWL